MFVPPPGYDDATVIPLERMKAIAEQIDITLAACKKEPTTALLGQLEEELILLQEAASELEGEPLAIAQDLYERFKRYHGNQDAEVFTHLTAELERLKSLF